jgi:thiol:disulfide interchange protein DsbC
MSTHRPSIRRPSLWPCALLAVALPWLALAAVPAPPSTAGADGSKADPRAAIAKKLGADIEDVKPSVVPGLYEVAHGSEVLYVSLDGRYVIDGDLYDAEKRVNLSDQRRAVSRLAALQGLSDDQAIIFAPATPRYTVTVFTDVDCTYCRKLHSQIADYLKLGIRVRYVFYPRTGPGTESWRKAEAVWCAPNRQEALTRAKMGEAIPARKCATPVAKTYGLGQQLAVTGTPGIFTEQGDYVKGYLPPDQLLERLRTGASVQLPIAN